MWSTLIILRDVCRYRKRELATSAWFFSVSAWFAMWAISGAQERDLVAGMSAVFFAAGLGILVINVYLERRMRGAPIGALVEFLWLPVISQRNGLTFAVGQSEVIGPEEWLQLLRLFEERDWDAGVLSEIERDGIYGAFIAYWPDLESRLSRLEAIMQSVVALMGWNFDHIALGLALRMYSACAMLLAEAPQNNSDSKAKWDRCGDLLTIHVGGQRLLERLHELAGESLIVLSFSQDKHGKSTMHYGNREWKL